MEQNKTTKYLKYSIGEIILVVIGILIALQINNWNQKQINNSNENLYLKNLKQDLENQTLEINKQITYEKNLLAYSESILHRFNKEKSLIIDSMLIIAVNGIADRRTFSTINPTYVELINTGNMTLLRDKSFKNQLISYQQEIERITEVIKLNNSSFIDTELAPRMRELIPQLPYFKNSQQIESLSYSGGISDFNIKSLSKDTQQKFEDKTVLMHFINLVSARYDYAWFDIQTMVSQREDTQKLIDMLNTMVIN